MGRHSDLRSGTRVRMTRRWREPRRRTIFEVGQEGTVERTEIAGMRACEVRMDSGQYIYPPPNALEEVK
jgi:hypothetical protein